MQILIQVLNQGDDPITRPQTNFNLSSNQLVSAIDSFLTLGPWTYFGAGFET